MSWGAAIKWAFSALWINAPWLCILTAIIIMAFITEGLVKWRTKTNTSKKRGRRSVYTSEFGIVTSKQAQQMKESALPASEDTLLNSFKLGTSSGGAIMQSSLVSEAAITSVTAVTSVKRAITSSISFGWSRSMAERLLTSLLLNPTPRLNTKMQTTMKLLKNIRS